MREQEFRAYMKALISPQGTQLRESTINFYIKSCTNIERVENKNLDEEFQKDGMASLYQLYSYSTHDENNNLPNPTKLPIKTRLYNALSDTRSGLNHYRRFCLSESDTPSYEVPDNNNDSSADTVSSTTFRLERDLQDSIRENITQLEHGLEIIDNGLEYKVKSGFIDILAKDSNGTFVVIELNGGMVKNYVIDQIINYMVDIADANELKFEQVRGIIIASDFEKWVRTASSIIPNLELRYYRYTFELTKEIN